MRQLTKNVAPTNRPISQTPRVFPQTFRGFFEEENNSPLRSVTENKVAARQKQYRLRKKLFDGQEFHLRPDFRLTAKISNFQFESFNFVHLPRASFCTFVREAHIGINYSKTGQDPKTFLNSQMENASSVPFSSSSLSNYKLESSKKQQNVQLPRKAPSRKIDHSIPAAARTN